MDNTSEAIDTVFRVTYMGIAYAFRLVGDISRSARFAGVIAAMNRQNDEIGRASCRERV